MKLKIEYIQNLITQNCGDLKIDKILTKDSEKIKSIKYPNEEAFIASEIVNDILPYLKNILSLHFTELYKSIEFADLKDSGYYLGIPFCQIINKDYSDTLKINIELIKLLIKEGTGDNSDATKKQIVELTKKSNIDNIDVVKRLYPLSESGVEMLNFNINRYSDKLNDLVRRKPIFEKMGLDFKELLQFKLQMASLYRTQYIRSESISNIEEFFWFVLTDSFYWFDFDCNPTIEYDEQTKVLLVEYYLPNIDEIPNIKEIKTYKTKGAEIKYLSERELYKIYDDFIYAITIRSIAEIFHFDTKEYVDTIMFNGRVISRNKATGKQEDSCILSVQVKRSGFEGIDLSFVDAKSCFKHFKGVGSSKLSSLTPITPIMELKRKDRRFVEPHAVDVADSTNLAMMDWEEFEHLVREIFDKEFNINGGEVCITQSSRDGGVDAVAFDPDPIRGGKTVIQAKRYTNTVGVSAVRDLYGTIINEGANKGILITTSDYGPDSYEFAKGKPITLLNGGHLLFLLEKHGQKARIDIDEAKRIAKLNQQ